MRLLEKPRSGEVSSHQPPSQASWPTATSQRTVAAGPTTRWNTTASASATAIQSPSGDQAAYRPWNVRGAWPRKQPRSISSTTPAPTERAAQLSGARSGQIVRGCSGVSAARRRAHQPPVLVAIDPPSVHEDGERAVDARRESQANPRASAAAARRPRLLAAFTVPYAARVVGPQATVEPPRPLPTARARTRTGGCRTRRASSRPGSRPRRGPLVFAEARLWILKVADTEMHYRTAQVFGQAVGDARPDPRGRELARRRHPGDIDQSARPDVEGAELAAARVGEGDATRGGHAGQPELRRLALSSSGRSPSRRPAPPPWSSPSHRPASPP